MIANITKASISVGLLGITILVATPAMANTARRDARQMRQVNRALRQDYKAQNRYIRAQDRYIRNNTYTPYYAPTPVYNPYYVGPNPGITVRFGTELSTAINILDPATRRVLFVYFYEK